MLGLTHVPASLLTTQLTAPDLLPLAKFTKSTGAAYEEVERTWDTHKCLEELSTLLTSLLVRNLQVVGSMEPVMTRRNALAYRLPIVILAYPIYKILIGKPFPSFDRGIIEGQYGLRIHPRTHTPTPQI